MDVRLPDGTIIQNVPEGTTKADLVAKLQRNGRAVPAEWLEQSAPQQAKPASVQAGEVIGGIPRQLGLATRYGIEGLASLADPVRMALNAVGVPGQNRPMSDVVGGLLTKAGLPEPQTANERVIGDASRLVAGAGGGSALLSKVAPLASGVTQQVLEKMAARPGMAALSAAGSGLAGGSVREAGGGPMAQFGASLAGGIAAPLAAQGAMNTARGIGNAARSLMASPQDLDAQLSIQLQRAGIDPSTIGASVKAQLREDAKKALVSGEQMDPAALRRLTDYRRIGATPLLGDITQDPAILSQQRNLSKQIANTANVGGTNLPALENANARRVLSTLEGATSSADDAFASGQRIIGAVTSKDAGLKAQENALYNAAKDSEGRALPLDRGGFLNEAFGNLARENKMAFLPENVSKFLETLGKGSVKVNGQEFPVPFDVNTIDQLKTTLATASRASADGNARAAIKAVRDALENVQPKMQDFNGAQLTTAAQAAALRSGDPAAKAMGAFDAARSFARDRRQWQESAGFIEDALGGAAPDKFVQKHIIGGTVDDLRKLRAEIGGAGVSSGRDLSTVTNGTANAQQQQSGQLLESVRKQMVDYILQRGRADSDTVKFSSSGMNDALKAIGERKLSMFFAPEEIAQLKSAVNVGRYMQSQPIGSAVNNSNTAGAALGRLSGVLDRLSPIPGVGPMVADPIKGGLLQMQVRNMNNVGRGLLAPQDLDRMAITPSLMLPGLLAAPTIN
jgi:hypothetical protein